MLCLYTIQQCLNKTIIGPYYCFVVANVLEHVQTQGIVAQVGVVYACPLLKQAFTHVCVCVCAQESAIYDKQESKTATDMPAVASFSRDTNAFVGTVR